jgi:hypothetical protein
LTQHDVFTMLHGCCGHVSSGGEWDPVCRIGLKAEEGSLSPFFLEGCRDERFG